MKKKVLMTCLLLLIMVSGIGIVSAATVTGTLGESNISSNVYAGLTPNNVGAGKIQGLFIRGTSSFTAPPVGVIFLAQDTSFTFDAGAPSGSSVTVSIRNGSAAGDVVGHGTFGYQRLYDQAVPPVAQYCYLWLAFSDLNLTGIPETDAVNHYTKLYFADFSQAVLYNISATSGSSALAPTGSIFFEGLGGGRYGGISSYTHTNNLDTSVYATYTATKPSGIGITGTIVKNNGGSQSYQSRGYVFNSTGAVIASEGTASTNDYNFSSYDSSLKLGIYANSVFFNSSVLFLPTTPTVTPTPTPTVTLNPGEFWLTFSAEDATTGGLIPGAEIDIYSEFTSTWNNATTTSGERTIATSQNHIFDAYGSATGYVNGSALDKIAYPNQNYLVKLFPSSGLPNVPGYVNLFVSVTERETGSPISGVSVTVSTPGSYTVNGETDNTGSEVFSTSNSSVKYITVSKSGYKSETRTITTPASGNYNAALQMSRVLVTTQPTSYIPPGGVTPQITVDPRSSTEKDQDMMNLVRDAGPNLIQLAIVVTMISLLGLMTRGFGK